MSADDQQEDEAVEEEVRERLEKRAEEVDDRIVELLSWVLDTETRARIYINLREHPNSTSEEIAEGTGLYPSTVREALAALNDEGTVVRRKREASGAGNNPYEYEAIPPSELVGDVIEEVQAELNTVFNLDEFLLGERTHDETSEGPITIDVREERADADDD